ncbi:sulfurtransferase TusA family protein [soil metagenome]
MSEIIVDARGHMCPVPSLRLQKALVDAGPGSTATLLATDPMARIDVPHLMKGLGGKVVSITESDGVLRLTVVLSAATGDAPTG